MEDPNLYLLVFLEVCNTLKINRASTDAIHLCLLPFSFKDKARAYLHSLPTGSIIMWEMLPKALLIKFFPLGKIMSLRNQITVFAQREDELLYKAWERLTDLMRLCPHHSLQKWMVCNSPTLIIFIYLIKSYLFI